MIVPIVSETDWCDWLAHGASVPAALESLTSAKGPVLIVAPHPDDETLGAGGLIAHLRSAGTEVIMAAVTDGENAYQGVSGLGAVRVKEQTSALSKLGVQDSAITRFHIPDSGIHEHEQRLTDLLEPLVVRARHVVAPWTHDFHPDHEACGRVAERLALKYGAELTFYLFWTWHRGTPDLLSGLPLIHMPLTEPVISRKLAALACHRSQLDREGGEPILSERLLAPAQRRFETYLPSRVGHA